MTLRDRFVEGWDRVLPASMLLGALLMLLQWRRRRRRRRRLKQLLKLDENGWAQPDA